MQYALQEIAAFPLAAKLLAAALGVLVIRRVVLLLEHSLPPHFGSGDVRHRIRKRVALAGYIVVFVFISILFKEHLNRLSFALGLFGAGLAVALQDMIASIGGWFTISFSNLYKVGDRIQVDETKGDVIDISLLRTTLMETGNWVRGDLYNGRVARIPNNSVLKAKVFNYSQGFRFVWDEVKSVFTHESDHVYARQMLLRVAEETVKDYLVEAQDSWKKVVENYRIDNPLLEPIVALVVSGGNLEFSISYIVDYMKRTVVKDQLFTKIAQEVANSNGRLQWASSTTNVQIEIANSDFKPFVQQPSLLTGKAVR